MIRSIWAVLFGVIVASLWIAVLRWFHGIFFPVMAELNSDDREAAARILADNSPMLLGLAVVYFIGTFIGGWIGGRTARRGPLIHGLIVGLVLFGIGIVNPRALPHPVWFWVVGLAAFPVAGSLGGWLAQRNQAKLATMQNPS